MIEFLNQLTRQLDGFQKQIKVTKILDLSKTGMQEHQYDYVKEKYGSKVKCCYILDTEFHHAHPS